MKKNHKILLSIILIILILLFLIFKIHNLYRTCNLPCIFELYPNVMSKDETIDYFNSKNYDIYPPEILFDGKIKIDVVNETNDETLEIQLKFKDNIFTDYYFYTNNKSVKLSIYELFSRYGKPTKVFINYSPQEADFWHTFVYLIYENDEFGVTYWTNRGSATPKGINFCFDDYPLLFNFNNTIEQNQNMKATALSVPMKSLELITEYDINSFYEFILNSNQTCIDIYIE